MDDGQGERRRAAGFQGEDKGGDDFVDEGQAEALDAGAGGAV